jgi:tRNA nucleotidyltransferase (CCA-adding enzyme)
MEPTEMPGIVNLASKIGKQLPIELVELMESAGLIAVSQGRCLYLVGGVVRDLLLWRSNLDLDLVVEGDAINLAQRLAEITGGGLTTHLRFGTAKLKWDKWSVDLAMARAETYVRPGALPMVKPSSLATDLLRRDFTINAMAVELIPGHWGRLIDLYGGWDDIRRKLIRILYGRSFVDDATRMWRAIRYEQRLGFKLEVNTRRRLERDVSCLDTISGDRIRHELELVLKEESPEKALRRAEELGVLARLHPRLKGDDWLAERFSEARQLSISGVPPVGLYLALFTYSLTSSEIEGLISYLRLSKRLARVLLDTAGLKTKLELLAKPKLRPSRVYNLLHDYSVTALTANSLATASTIVRQHIQLFLIKLRYVKSALSGEDLKKIGIPVGPRMKEILQELHEARLDMRVTSRKEEMEMVRGRVGKKNNYNEIVR